MIFSADANTPDVEKRVWCDFLVPDSRIDEVLLRNWSKKDGRRGMDEEADTDATRDESTAKGSQFSTLLLLIFNILTLSFAKDKTFVSLLLQMFQESAWLVISLWMISASDI